jgi:hypothetical protein
MATNWGRNTVGLGSATSMRSSALSHRRRSSGEATSSASIASRAAQDGGRIPGAAVTIS